jgi:hypothetical protein
LWQKVHKHFAHSLKVGSDAAKTRSLSNLLANESQLDRIHVSRFRDDFLSSHHCSQADATRPTTNNRRLRSPHVALIVDWQPVSGNATR